MKQTRMTRGLMMALGATDPDPNDRYQAAMIRRTNDILARAKAAPDPALILSESADALANKLRHAPPGDADLEELRAYVTAKLQITNPDYTSEQD